MPSRIQQIPSFHELPPPIDTAPRRYKDAPTTVVQTGYIYEWCPTHPYALYGMVMQHRLVMESSLGRFLDRQERVHHRNHVRNDNRIENLHLYATQADHQRDHWAGKGRRDPVLIERVRQVAADPSIPMSDLGISYGSMAQICRENDIKWLSRGYRGRVAGLSDETARGALQGRTAAEAAKILKVHPMTLYNRFSHIMNKRTTPGFLDQHMAKVLRLRRIERMSSADIGKQFGVSDGCVRKSIQRWSKQGAIRGVSDYRDIPRTPPGPKPGRKRLGKAW